MTNSNFNPNNQQSVAQNILKCFGEDINIQKAEGSRGGKVIGHTKSGKPVYEHITPKHYHVQGYIDGGEHKGKNILMPIAMHRDTAPNLLSDEYEEMKKIHSDYKKKK